MSGSCDYQRHAIFWLPDDDSALAEFGRRWFGVDWHGNRCVRDDFGLPGALSQAAVARPSRYTLHATMKAPFRLEPSRGQHGLIDAMRAFCARRVRRMTGPLHLVQFARHLALVPGVPRAELDWLASECVTAFDPFRAAPDATEHHRFSTSGLSTRQAQYAASFGYPYVLAEFEFHITLAGPLSKPELDIMEQALRSEVTALLAPELRVDSLCLLGDRGGDAPFELIERFALR
jgi:hypothetical protein